MGGFAPGSAYIPQGNSPTLGTPYLPGPVSPLKDLYGTNFSSTATTEKKQTGTPLIIIRDNFVMAVLFTQSAFSLVQVNPVW